MRYSIVAMLAAACAAFIVATASVCAAAGNDSVSIPALMQQLESADTATRMNAVEALSQVGAEAVEPLFSVMGGENRTTDLAARIAVQRMVHQAAAPKSRMDRAAIAQALAQQATSNRPVIVRTLAVRMLSFIGGDAEVPALAQLLANPEMGEIARWALVRIPGKASIDALAGVLPNASGELRIGIINALGARHDAGALPALEAAVKADDPAVRAAALQAAAHIPGSRSEKLIRASIESGPAGDKAAAWDGYVKFAETTLAGGDRDAAGSAYRYIYDRAPNGQTRCAGVIGLGKVGTAAAIETVVTALGSGDRDLRGAAVEALVAAPRSATPIIADAMTKATGARKVALVEVLGKRGDPAATKQLAAASDDKDQAVRVAATAALGAMAEAAVPPLIARLQDKSENVRETAELALIQVRGRDATAAEVKAVKGAPTTVRIALLGALGNRKDAAAMPSLVAALGDSSPTVRVAALEGIGVSARLTDAATRTRLVEVLRTGDETERKAAEHALSRVPASMIGASEKSDFVKDSAAAPAPARAALVRVMAAWNDPSLLPVFLEAAHNPAEEVAVAGLGGLTPLLGDPAISTVAPPIDAQLLGIAEGSDPAVKAAALQAYVIVADQRRKADAAGALAMYDRALKMANDDATRRMALRGLTPLADVQSLPLIEPLLDKGGAMKEAAAVVMPIADKLAQAGDKRKAIDLYSRVIRATSDRGLMQAAVERLRPLGVDLDIAAEAGFVTHWWVLGPFPGRKQMTERDVIDTSKAVDVGTPATVDGKTFNWKYVRVSDPTGMLDLRATVAQEDDCAAYAYAEVTSNAERDVIFKIGSDDAVVCWLNGKHIHSYNEDRGYAPDQDIVPTHLKAGTNAVLMKVLNGGADWACGLRITDTDNAPLKLAQRGK
jgi:HEAT repeat protein